MSSPSPTRLTTELALLTAIYPEVAFHPSARELRYSALGPPPSALSLRLPESYPTARPEVLVASSGAVDLRDNASRLISGLPEGEECLDVIISGFIELVEGIADAAADADRGGANGSVQASSKVIELAELPEMKTVIIHLHHLLATSKRRAVLHPASSDVCGITRPGYPGVLVFSGPAGAVDAHVAELRHLNWAAFNVRWEVAEDWTFVVEGEVVRGVREVEAIGEVVDAVQAGGRRDGELEGERRRVVFLSAMGIK